ncbi:LXG domain-containing protein [Listeria seeligeri]|uniref:T7SS effector LXG polymorphic toxin n=1 Tax=Listeria seeligeri TaxID=1640 RepID=UPI0018879206|nr:T7SS effector LXG polymorphic toxin [Listeria seeligeri]MBF2656056.1 LXG domain-containing protein [Listeria seeligeri]
MSRIDIGEVQTFLTQLRTSNENGEKAIQSIQKVVTQYAEDDSLKGKAIDASKRYYQATYISLCDAMKEAMSESEDRLSQYIQDFHAQVDSSANAKIDAAGLYELELKIDKIERNKEDLAQRMNSGTEGQMQNYRSQLSAAYKKENILEKYLSFEQSHGSFFENLTVLVQSIQQTVRELQNNIQFNSQTGTYDMSKLNLSSVSRMQQALNKSRGIKEDIVKELQEYTVLAVVYVDSNGKEQVMWLLERDGVGVENAELKAYLEENGKYLNPEDYTIITNEDLNKKINKAWQDGIYYLNGNKYDGLAGGILSTSAYVEAGKGYVDKSGLADIVLGLGLSTAAIRGSTTFGKKSSGLDVPEETVTYRRVQGGDSKDLLLVNDDGTLSLNSTWKSEHNLNVSTGQDHANYFQGKRPDSYVVEFEVPQYLDDLIRENAISQNGYKTNPLNQGGTAPKIVDKGVFDKFNFEGVAYELPDPINQWLVEYAKKARIVK